MTNNTNQKSYNFIPDYEPLFNENADDIKKAPTKILTGIFKENFAHVILSSVLYVIKACPTWVIPTITANIINAVTYISDASVKNIIINCFILVLSLAQNVPMHVLYARFCDRMLRNIGAGLRNTLVKKLQHLSFSYHKEIESGRIQAKFLRDIEAIEFFDTHFIKTVIPAFISIIITAIITLSKSPAVALFYLVVIPANVFLVRSFRNKMKSNNYNFRHENENVSAKVTTMIEMLPITKAHGLENEEIEKLENNIKKLKETGLILDKTNAYFGSIAWVLGQALSGLCLVFTSYLAYIGKIPVGDILLYQSFFTQISVNIQTLVGLFPELTKGIESVRSVSEIALCDKVEDEKNKLKLRYIHGSLNFENVYFRYPNSSKDIIKDFSLDIQQGECVAFVGASGSGKSTIMNMIIGFLMPTSGTVKIDGKPIDMINLSTYRHFISVVPQNTVLFKGTIRDNILYGINNISEKKFQEILEHANINEFLAQLPDGINTSVGEHGDKLSGGQKQRISIARALIRDPKILIFDEATSALDNISERHVQKAISTLIKNRTTFIVAHRLSTIRDADKIVVMDEGRIVEIGTFDELMEKKEHFYELKKLNDIGTE